VDRLQVFGDSRLVRLQSIALAHSLIKLKLLFFSALKLEMDYGHIVDRHLPGSTSVKETWIDLLKPGIKYQHRVPAA